jgi:hypothetical protein
LSGADEGLRAAMARLGTGVEADLAVELGREEIGEGRTLELRLPFRADRHDRIVEVRPAGFGGAALPEPVAFR